MPNTLSVCLVADAVDLVHRPIRVLRDRPVPLINAAVSFTPAGMNKSCCAEVVAELNALVVVLVAGRCLSRLR